MKDFRILIIGTDINAYNLARCYHEYTGRVADMYGSTEKGRKPLAFTKYSSILNMQYKEGLWDESRFLKALDEYYELHKDEKILLISSNETYAEFIAKNKKKLQKKYYFSYPSLKLERTLVNKSNFYKTFKNSCLDLPKTEYYNCKNDKTLKLDLKFPIILKPANVIKFKHMWGTGNFKGQKKIYYLKNKSEVIEVINRFKDAGYDDILILQEYIPGDDTHLFDAVVYCDKNSEVKLISFAQIGLQEHMSSMIGNATVLINGYSQYPGVEKQIKKIKKFMSSIKYQSFAEIDMKYDERDKKFKVLEINARQGRCSYYITPCGYNLVEILARDLIYNEKIDYQIIDKEQLLTYVPKSVINKNIKNKEYKNKVLKLWNKRVNPLKYKNDKSFLRKILLIMIDRNYRKHYKEHHLDWK